MFKLTDCRELMLLREMCVTLRHCKGFVSKDFLNRANINTPHREIAPARMPQVVKAEITNARLTQRRIPGGFPVRAVWFTRHGIRKDPRRSETKPRMVFLYRLEEARDCLG